MKFRIVAAVVLALALPAHAHAHGTLKASTPVAGANLTAPPTAIHLLFSEVPSLALTSIRLVGPNGEDVPLATLARATDSASAVTAAIAGALSSGVYTVQWQMAGDDGHPNRGSYQFTLVLSATMSVATPPAQPQTDPVSQPDDSGFGVESPAYVAIRWLQYCALLMVIGTIAFVLVVLSISPGLLEFRELDEARLRAATLAMGATAVLAVTALMRWLAQSYAMQGKSLVPDPGMMITLVRASQWGRAWLLEVGAIIAALVAFARARRGLRAGWWVAAVAAGALALSTALSGHAAATPTYRILALTADSLHIIGAGGWLGSLLVLVAVALPVVSRGDGPERWQRIGALVNAFSPTALVFASVAAVTGVFAAWLHLDTIFGLWQTRYGQILLLKLAVLSITAGIGLYNWKRVKPVLDAGPDGMQRLQRSAAAEVAIGVLVLLITAVLVATPTGMDM